MAQRTDLTLAQKIKLLDDVALQKKQRYFIEQGLDRTKIDDCADKIHLNSERSLNNNQLLLFSISNRITID